MARGNSERANERERARYTEKLDMGRLRLVASLKLQVSLAKEPYKRDYILQKRPMILRSLLIVATSYTEKLSPFCSFALSLAIALSPGIALSTFREKVSLHIFCFALSLAIPLSFFRSLSRYRSLAHFL